MNNMVEKVSTIFDKAMGGYEVNNLKEIKTDDGSSILSKEYSFINPLGNRSTMKTFDYDIIESTERIALALHGKKILNFAICKELSKIKESNKLESLGFKNIGDYAYALFDISRVTATQYARIGKIFINDDYTIKSEILPSGLTKSHFVEMLTYINDDEPEEAIHIIENQYLEGTITDGMSTIQLRKALKSVFKGDKEALTDKSIKNSTKKGGNSDLVEKVDTTSVVENEQNVNEMSNEQLYGMAINGLENAIKALTELNKNELVNELQGLINKVTMAIE